MITPVIEQKPRPRRSAADRQPAAAIPLYQPRLAAGELAAAYDGIPEAYAAGDYAFVARFGADEPELQAAALILIGSPLRGIELLRRHSLSSPRARLMEAFAAWYLGQEAQARANLEDLLPDCPDEGWARALSGLLARPRLEVLVATSRPAFARALRRIPGFAVRSVGLPGQGCDLELDDELRLGASAAGRAALASADLFLLFDLGVPVPSDLGARPLPKFAYVPDIEMHLPNDAAILAEMDALIAPTSQVAAELRALYPCRVFSLPILGAPSATHDAGPFPEGALPEKSIDILFTGSIATPLYIEKPGRFLRLAQIPGCHSIRLLDKTFPLETYKRLLASARFTAVSLRFDGGVSTRAIEALRLGTFALCLSPTDHDLYLDGPEDGIFPAHGTDQLVRIGEYLRDYEWHSRRFAERRADLRARLSTLFPRSPGLEQRWLKLLAFLSLQIVEPKPGPGSGNTALTWFNARLFENKTAAGHRLLAAPAAPDHAIKSIVTEATLAIDADDWPRLRALANQAAPPTHTAIRTLNPALLAGLLWLKAGNIDAAETLLARLWAARDNITGDPTDGLIFFDFWLSNDLRRDFVSEALYGDAVVLDALRRAGTPGARRGSDPTRLLLSGVGSWLSLRRAASGQWADAAELAALALDLAPENFAAMQRLGLARLADPDVRADRAARRKALDLLSRAVGQWPWYLTEILPLLHSHSELNQDFLEGEAHAAYLRYVQRVRTDRRGVADFRLARAVRPYLRGRLGLVPEADCSPETVAACLEAAGLRLSEPEFFLANVVLPLVWDAGEELRRGDEAAAEGLFAQAEAVCPEGAAPLRAELEA